ncbi:leucine-rich repeat and IQ domain-containing protein 1 [Sphaeramia orbicularis]|uniref:leucine-rich repeat and IQ domain-containing protein 1 n=1 Tax=Sphaeramia orbicularis TaxID=375764 RepID=UPI00117D5B9F|nr:leucine-rich repeat and IQ domain-containing protein 1 [Sphaeramia orbicularis]
MADANEVMQVDEVVLSNSDEQDRFTLHHEEVSDTIPLSLLSYFEASKSRAADCEKFMLEELEVISDETSTDGRTECDGKFTAEAQSLDPAKNEDDGKKKSGCELERTQEQSRLREREFQEELRRLTEAEKLQQVELQLMAKRAQEKLEQECLLQQELIYNLKRRVEEERKMRNEEQKKMKEEQQRRKKEEEEKRTKENEERRKREEEKMKRRNLEEAIRRRKEDEARRKVEMRNKEEEESRKREEEERREKEEKEKSKREGEGEKHVRKKRDVIKRAHEEEERKTKETVKKEEEAAVDMKRTMEEERKNRKEAEQVKMKVAERKNKEGLEKIKREEEGKNEDKEKMEKEERERRNKEQEKIKTEDERRNKEVEKVKKMEEERKNKEAVEGRRPEEEERKNKVEKMKKEQEEIKYQEEVEIKEEEEAERKNEDAEKMKEKEQEREKEEVERKNVDEEKKRKMEDEVILENEGWSKTKEHGKKTEEVRLTMKEEEENDGNENGRKDEGIRLKMEEKNRTEEEEQKGKESNQKEMEEEGWKKKEEKKQKMEEAAKSKEGGEDYRNGREETKERERRKTSGVSGRKEEHERNGKEDGDEKETQEEEGGNQEETEVREEGLHEDIQVDKPSVPPPPTEPHDLDMSRTQTMCSASGTFCLQENTEHKRLAWMEDCVSWSKVSQMNRMKQRGSGASGRRPRRAEEAGRTLDPLPPDALLQDTAWKTLKEVTTVNLRDMSGRSFSMLAQCRCLRSLTLRRCGLKALEDVNQLPELCHVDVQENEISFVDCENMTSLRVLRLGHNKLTSIHGLRGVENLDVLDLSHNSVSRIAGLESMRRLQRLSVDHNQLISTKGLRDVSTLLHLDCSHNHLASVEGLDHCVLLSTLDLRSNSLSQPPALNNHVLLRELRLDDNSISSLQELAACWLPIMQHLSVAQNRITQLPCMSDFVSLENLDLHFNCLSELNNVCQSLQRCRFLREVHLAGNPLTQERGWRSSLQKAVSSLRTSDGQDTDSPLSPPGVHHLSPASGSFLSLCQLQLQQIHDLQQHCSTRLSAASSSLDAVQISCQHFTQALQLAEEHRLAHEHGDTSGWDTHETTVQTTEDSRAEGTTERPHVDPEGRTSPAGCWTSETFSTEQLYNTVPTRPVKKIEDSTVHPLATERKTCTDERKTCSDERKTCSDERKTCTDERKTCSDERKTCSDERKTCSDERKTCSDERKTCSDERKTCSDERKTCSDERKTCSDERKTCTDERKTCSDERKTCTDETELAHVAHHQDLHLRNVAAVVIQQRWRKHKQKSGNMYSPPTAEQGGVEGGGGEPAPGPVSVDGSAVSQDYAATVIQAFWRGFALRRRLTSALGAVTCPDTGHDDTLEEVDVDEFVFDEAALEKDWLLSLSEDSASRGYLESQQLLWMKPVEPFPGPSEDVRLSSMVQRPKQAWVNREAVDSSPGSSHSDFKSESPASASASVISGLSERSERILEEWGFTDSHTALLMLKRAQRMKPKKQQKLKDPHVRLALFRSCAHQLGPGEARHRPQPQNRYHIQDAVGEVEPELQQAEKSESERVSLQTWSHESDGKTESEHFLPEISSSVLSGGRVQLVADPGHTQRLHHASSSLSAQPCSGNHYPRRNSVGHERKDIPSAKRVPSGPNKKERISFRDNPVQLSVGWGGGAIGAGPAQISAGAPIMWILLKCHCRKKKGNSRTERRGTKW